MSIKLMSEIWESAECKGAELLTLLALADHARDDGCCWPSLRTIAAKARVSDDQARRHINNLIEKGYIQKQERFDHSGRQTSNGYRVMATPDLARVASTRGGEWHPREGEDGIHARGEGGIAMPPLEPSEGTINRNRKRDRARKHIPTPPPIDLSLPNPPTEEEMAQPLQSATSVRTLKYKPTDYTKGPLLKGVKIRGGYVNPGAGINPVQIFHERYAIDEFPLTHPQQDDLSAIVTDLHRWRDVVIAWSQAGYNPRNLKGQLDWYHAGIPKRTENRNHASNQGTGSNGRPRPHWADYDPKQDEYNPDRAAVLAGWSDEEDIDDYAEYKKQLAAQKAAV